MDKSWARVVTSFVRGTQMNKARDEREISLRLMARKQSFVYAYLEEDGHLKRCST